MATIRDAGIFGDYVHKPLSDPQAEIRLVQIDLSGDRDSDIHCTVSTHSLERPPPYIAISYTWGDSSNTRGIWINNGRLHIGHNSWLALWQARLHRVENPLRIWIDVLSIDQANDVEKSIQVGLMAVIFKSATHVIASVGVHENDSEYLAEQVHAHADYVELSRRLEGQKSDPPVDPRYCCHCMRSLDHEVEARRCNDCAGTPLFCLTCDPYHKETGHTLDQFYWTSLSNCSRCHRSLPVRWYESRDTNIRFCRTCVSRFQGFRNETDTDGILFDFWGAVDKPAKGRRKQFPAFTCSRLLEMANESQQRIANAFSAFSFRRYFTRLWVRVSTATQFVQRIPTD
jgi:hypothetical protein